AGSLGGLLAFAVQAGTLSPTVALAAVLLLSAISFYTLMKLRARNEDEADQAAVAEVGAAALVRALAKAHELNGPGNGGPLHRSLESRLSRICNLEGITY